MDKVEVKKKNIQMDRLFCFHFPRQEELSSLVGGTHKKNKRTKRNDMSSIQGSNLGLEKIDAIGDRM